MCVATQNRQKITKKPFLKIKVIRGHRCWHS